MLRLRKVLSTLVTGAVLAPLSAVTPAFAEDVPKLVLQYTHDSDMPQAAKDAMEVVEDLLDDILASPIPVRMKINWDLGGDPNTLASAGAVANPLNFPNAPRQNIEYPVALANALAGQDLTPGEFHVESNINGDIPWDYSVGVTDPDQLDFIGTMLHEVLHGLGFAGYGTCNGDTCWITGDSDQPGIFDTFLVGPGDKAMISYQDFTPELRDAMISDQVFWNGPLGIAAARSAASGTNNCGEVDRAACPTRPKIHAPTTFEPGSSMSHWDELTYSATNPNAMMTAAGAEGENAQFIGPMTGAILTEIGWPSPGDAATAPGPPPGAAYDRNPATTERVNTATPTAAAIAMSRASFGDDGATVATISRDDKFADALAASALGAYGPLLFTNKDTLSGAVRAEVDRVLPAGATVYIVGGTGAVSQAIEDELVGAGYKVTRLRGASRFETAVRIAEEVVRLNPSADTLLFARGFGPASDPEGSAAWADSISAAAYAASSKNPLLLVQPGAIPEEVRTYLTSEAGQALQSMRWVVLGGTSAVSQAVYDELGADLRVRGSGREATSIAIARELFGVNPTGVRNYAIVHGRDAVGWGWGLAVSGVAGRAGAPILLVTDQVTPEVLAEVRGCGAHQVDLLVSGPTSVISANVSNQLDRADNNAC